MPAQACRLVLLTSIQVRMRAHSVLACAGTILAPVISQMALAAPRSLVTIADQMMHEEDIDADEYMWETLPGRCCFQELTDDCDTCSVWSDPENFCHMTRDNCEHCGAAPLLSPSFPHSGRACSMLVAGMSLYCAPPPPLLDANKVCKGNSKVGIGCEDDLDTGICKRAGALKDCQAACRKTEHCEIVVLYTDAMTGTCVLWCALGISK